jgi:hypothetical protein
MAECPLKKSVKRWASSCIPWNMMQIQCPKCAQRLQIPDLKPGRMIRLSCICHQSMRWTCYGCVGAGPISPSEKQPVWICATANVMNFAIFLEIVEKRFGVEIDRP